MDRPPARIRATCISTTATATASAMGPLRALVGPGRFPVMASRRGYLRGAPASVAPEGASGLPGGIRMNHEERSDGEAARLVLSTPSFGRDDLLRPARGGLRRGSPCVWVRGGCGACYR